MLWVTTALAAVACASGAAYGKRLWIVIGVLLDVPSIYYLFGLPWWVSHDLGRLSIALALLILVTGLTRRARLVLWASIGLLFLVQVGFLIVVYFGLFQDFLRNSVHTSG